MTFTDLAKSYVRTVVPFIVGLVVAFAARHGVKLDAQETAALGTVVGAVYFALVRLLERYVTPKFGWLLGLAQQPVYAKVRTRRDRPKVPANSASFATATTGNATYVPSSLSSTITLSGSWYTTPRLLGVDQPRSIHDHLALLPEPSDRKGGALPSPLDERDYKATLPTSIPASCDFGAGIPFGMLLNDRIGDCYPAALLHALQVLSGGVFTPTDADALAVYEQVTGYDPTKTDANGNNPTDRGTYGRQLFSWAKAHGLITSYAAVPTDRASIRAAIAGHKAVLCEWALPIGADREGDHWTMPRSGKQAGSWGGHATVEVGYTTRHNRNVTWGEEGTVSPPFEDAYLQAAWVVETPAVIPPIRH